ncbi:MAG: hypothetical protein WCF65_07545 [Parachlamydiaceae bacterium]
MFSNAISSTRTMVVASEQLTRTLVLHTPDRASEALFQKLRDMFPGHESILESYWPEPRSLSPSSLEEREALSLTLCHFLYKFVRPAIREGNVDVPLTTVDLLSELLSLSIPLDTTVIHFKIRYLFEGLNRFFSEELLAFYRSRLQGVELDSQLSREKLSFVLCRLLSRLLLPVAEDLPPSVVLQFKDQIDDLLEETIPQGDTVESFKKRIRENELLRFRLDKAVRGDADRHDDACRRVTEIAINTLQTMADAGRDYEEKLLAYADASGNIIPPVLNAQDLNGKVLEIAAVSLAQLGADIEQLQAPSKGENALVEMLAGRKL